MDPFKLHVELNGNKFDGEGPTEVVNAAFQAWIGIARKPAAAAPTTSAAATPPDPGKHDSAHPDAMDALYKRVYVEREGGLTLQALPADPGDALLMLIHGYQKLKPDEYPITAVRLMQVAKTSGVVLDRLDRALAAKETFLMKSGYKRSTRYSLNNRGEQSAIATMKTLFE
jgi:hypothetical protein